MKKRQSSPIFDDSDFPISVVRKSIFQGTGTDLTEAGKRPIVAIANSLTEINPGHMHLGTIAQRVKDGVNMAGGLPFEFNVPAPCDGMTEGHPGMRFVLAQRDLIADLIETHVRSMRYDGIVFIASCDKIIPGMIMAAARLDLPAIFVTGGPNAWDIRFKPGMRGGVDHKCYTDLLDKLATATAATCGSCEVMGTANTMQSLTEALGICLAGSATVPAFHSAKLLYARHAGQRIVDLIEKEMTMKKIITQQSLENALMVNLAIGGSTNAALHLPAIAHELGLELSLSRFNDYNRIIPTLCGISPNGPHGMVDLFVAGGIPAVMKRLGDHLHRDPLTVSGMSIGDIIDQAEVKNPDVIPDKTLAFQPEGGTAVLFGNLAPEGAVVKQSAVADKMRVFTGPARVFDAEADALKAIREKTLKEGEVIVIRYEGPRGGPGMPETLAVTMGLDLAGFTHVALITDGRFSGATAGPCIGHVSPEAASGGPIAIVENGDIIRIDIPARKLDVDLKPETIQQRLANWKPVVKQIPSGYMQRYVNAVTSAAQGAVLK
ncbi:MAG TPA: dihydroxy-acid dehydratase [Smithella sp.]|nr:dihydroxy-acid dehydratase [Smithella sp.]HNY49701.1 dihydroxy-acid dehydratase [Smithella sp.]HOG89253.1 dihydroxy-acid dehydratase [Smithella sp.]HOU51267.1 dihydroxy-acid dehydratase [Smithella sp.]HQG64888.1 dihydroxy-acid dehydratase [Smithella sp.]